MQTPVGFSISAIKADPVRNLAYVVDERDDMLLEFDMTTGQVVNSVSVLDGQTSGQICISPDGSTLFLSETNEGEISEFTLPSLTPIRSISTYGPTYNMAVGVNGRLFIDDEIIVSTTSRYEYIIEIDPVADTLINYFGLSENYTSQPLLRTNASGTTLYGADPTITGASTIYSYDLSGGSVGSAVPYNYNSGQLLDYQIDDSLGRIYVANFSYSGVNVIVKATDTYNAVWPLLAREPGAVGFTTNPSVVYGASVATGGDIRIFNRSSGNPIADFNVSTGTATVQPQELAVAQNGNCLYFTSDAFGAPNTSTIGIISTTGLVPTLNGTIPTLITFPVPNPVMVGSTYTLTATDSAGLPIIYTVVSGPGQIINGNQLKITGAGNIVVEAQVLGTARYAAESTTITINVPIKPQTISAFQAIGTQLVGVPFSITIPTASSGLPVKLSVISGVATISGSTITAKAAGTLVLAADQPGNAAYAPAPEVTTSITVDPGPQTISPFKPIAAQYLNVPNLNVVLPTATSGLPVTISVQSGPATISGTHVTLNGVGTVVLAADQGGNSNYTAAPEVTVSFSVYASPQSIGAFAKIANRVYSATPFNVTPPTASSGLPVTLSVQSGPATIAGTTVTLTGAGVVVIAADQVGNLNFSPATTVTTSFTVTKAPQTINAFTPIASTTFGSAPLTVTMPTASSGLPVLLILKSGPASITGNVVTLTGSGTVVLAADQPGNSAYNAAKEVTTSFTVGRTTQTLGNFAVIGTQTAGTVFAVTPPVSSAGLPVTLAVKSGPAKISAGDIVTVTGIGTVTLVANQTGTSGVAAATPVTTSFQVVQGTQSIAAFNAIPVQVYGGPSLTITPPAASSGLPVKFSIVSGPAKVSGNTISFTGAGAVVLAANQAGNSSFQPAAQVTTTITVDQASQSIGSFRPIALKPITAPPFRVVIPASTSRLAVTVTVQSGPATISGNLVTVTGSGVVTLAANQPGNANYNAAPTVTTTFTVQ